MFPGGFCKCREFDQFGIWNFIVPAIYEGSVRTLDDEINKKFRTNLPFVFKKNYRILNIRHLRKRTFIRNICRYELNETQSIKIFDTVQNLLFKMQLKICSTEPNNVRDLQRNRFRIDLRLFETDNLGAMISVKWVDLGRSNLEFCHSRWTIKFKT